MKLCGEFVVRQVMDNTVAIPVGQTALQFNGMIMLNDVSKLIWECPRCHNKDQNKLNVARRTCGYIGTQFWNQGRTQEIRDRVLHL